MQGVVLMATAEQPLTRCEPFRHKQPSPELLAQLKSTFNSTEVYVLSSFALLALVFIIFTQAKFPSIRSHPGDLMLMVSLGAAFVYVNLFASALYYDLSADPFGSSFSPFCQASAFFSIAGNATVYLYNGLFYIYYLSALKRALRSKPPFNKKLVHLVALGLVALALVLAYGTNNVGMSINGYCFVQANYLTPFIESAVILVFLAMSLCALMLAHRTFPDMPELQALRRQQLAYNLFYLVLFTVLALLQVLSKVVSTVKCMQNDFEGLQPFITVGRIADLSLIIVIAFIRLFDPAVWGWLRQGLGGEAQLAPRQPILELELQNASHILNIHRSKNWLHSLEAELTRQRKAALVNAFLFCLENDYTESKFFQEVAFKEELEIRLCTEDTGEIADLTGMSTPNCGIVVYSPRLFGIIRRRVRLGEVRFDKEVGFDQEALGFKLQFKSAKRGVRVFAREIMLKEVRGLIYNQDKLLSFICTAKETSLETPVFICCVRLDGAGGQGYYIFRREAWLPEEAVLSTYRFKPLLNRKQELQHINSKVYSDVQTFLAKESHLAVDNASSLRNRLLDDVIQLEKMGYYSYHLRVDLINAELFRRLTGLTNEELSGVGLFRRVSGEEDELLYRVLLRDCYKVSEKGDSWAQFRQWVWGKLGRRVDSFPSTYSRMFIREVLDPLMTPARR